MSTCAKCGSHLPTNAAVCPWCGEPTPDAAARGVAGGLPAARPQSSTLAGAAIGIGAGIVMLGIALVVLASTPLRVGTPTALTLVTVSFALAVALLVASYTPAAPAALRAKRRLLTGLTIGCALPYAAVGGLFWMCSAMVSPH